jgi:hypothetical protein
MGEEQVSGKKSLGQVAYEALWQEQSRAIGCGIPPWPQPLEVKSWQRWWEAAGQAVKAAVLAEQAGPQGPGGMAQQEDRTRAAITEALIGHMARRVEVLPVANAIEDAIVAGLKEWEQWR